MKTSTLIADFGIPEDLHLNSQTFHSALYAAFGVDADEHLSRVYEGMINARAIGFTDGSHKGSDEANKAAFDEGFAKGAREKEADLMRRIWELEARVTHPLNPVVPEPAVPKLPRKPRKKGG